MNTNKETTATEQIGAVAHARPSALRRTVEKVTDGSWHSVIYAALFVVIVIAFRKGVVGEIAEWWKARQSSR